MTFEDALDMYPEWEANRVLPNPGTCAERWLRFLFHLYRNGYINVYEFDAWNINNWH